MPPYYIELIRTSFDQVELIADLVAELFYRRLYQLDPTLKPLFRNDMTIQNRKLMKVLHIVVNSLDRLDKLVPAVESLGRRHATYNVSDEHFTIAGAALLWALEQALGDTWTPSTEAAWTEAYELVSDVLRTSMRQARHTAPMMLAA